ncbi:FAD:protein FMN transferase [Lactobacillus sp. PV037]|uniref:FAD:protein FMN transferase n=1 Tax=unclassified Lactobacillus TaxID=2620435 RepID=UPI00223EFD53|nr:MULTISPECIES: FAD:protein FMN transferase [unclassified Lactobacillus]QNQ82812.1 FAD:protein FMN transferase [Lactobacillus sp. PV012]QNQ83066.1 FAD:protein FMN transferase [Lactobacillus sp. PV037]
MTNLDVLTTTHYALGTKITLKVWGSRYESILAETVKLIDHYEDLFTVNRSYSEIIAVNQAAGKNQVTISHPSFVLAKIAILESQKNYGFNALMGPVVNSWRIGFEDAHVPSKETIREKLALTNPKNIEINQETESIFLRASGMELDLGGIAKGYIADRICDLWHAYDVRAGIINLGGNILFVNKSPKRKDGRWLVGVQDPQKERGKNITLATVNECSVVTSGVNERFLQVGEKVYHHLLDPATGYPLETNLFSVTTFTKDSIQAELECKRLFFCPDLIDHWQNSEKGRYGAIIIYKDRTIKRVGV